MSEGSFEAKLTVKRETAAGIYLTVQVQPDDYQAELATLRVGSTLLLGWAEIVNTAVEPIELARTHGPQPESPTTLAKPNAGKAEPQKDRRPFSSLPFAQQAGMRCADKSFQQFLVEQIGMSEGEEYAGAVRRICGVDSRSDLKDGTVHAKVWCELDSRYQSWLTDRQYAGARR